MFKLLILIIIICLLSAELPLVVGVQKFNIRAASAKFNPKYFSNFTLYSVNSTLYVDMWIINTLEPGFRANLDFQYRLQNSDSYHSLFNYDVDVCSTVITLKNNLMKKWFKSGIKFGNFMENCPVYKGHYYLNGWYMDSALAPKYLYPGDYLIKGYGYYGSRRSKNEDMVVDIEMKTDIQ